MSSDETYQTQATSIQMPALQAESALEPYDQMEPLHGDLAGSFDLVAPAQEAHQGFSLEARSLQILSHEHLQVIFEDPSLLLRFTAFLSTHRPQSVPILIYYLDALKALKVIKYGNAIAEALSPIPGHDFTAHLAPPSINTALDNKANQAFAAMVKEDLPAYVTQMYIQIVSLSISQRITGVLAPHLREASEGLAEVFCLTDPSRPENPIVFASEGKWIMICQRSLDANTYRTQNSAEQPNMAWHTPLDATAAFFKARRLTRLASAGYQMRSVRVESIAKFFSISE